MRSTLRKQLSVLVQRRLQIERRRVKRIVPVRRTLCLIGSCGSDAKTTAIVHNLSSTGIAMQDDSHYAPGTILHLLLVNDAHTFSLAVEMNVVRSIPKGDHYLIAGPFTRHLLHEEVVPFIV